MIHIKEDKRSQKSANLLAEGLVKSLNEKDFDTVTISDLQKYSGVSRATFYRLFDTVEDVLAFKCEQLAEDLKTRFVQGEDDADKNFLRFTMSYWIRNSEYIEAMYKAKRPDIFQEALLKQTETDDFVFGSYRYNQESEGNNEALRRKKEYVVSAVIGSLSSTLMCWIRNGRKETPEELYATFIEFGRFMDDLYK